MGYKSDHGFRTDLWKQATRGLPHDYVTKAHRHLEKYYRDTKDEMTYDQLLGAVKEVMNDYPEWRWNGQKWIQS